MPQPAVPAIVTKVAAGLYRLVRAKFAGGRTAVDTATAPGVVPEFAVPPGSEFGETTITQVAHVANQVSGTTGKVLQAGDVRGGIHF